MYQYELIVIGKLDKIIVISLKLTFVLWMYMLVRDISI